MITKMKKYYQLYSGCMRTKKKFYKHLIICIYNYYNNNVNKNLKTYIIYYGEYYDLTLLYKT